MCSSQLHLYLQHRLKQKHCPIFCADLSPCLVEQPAVMSLCSLADLICLSLKAEEDEADAAVSRSTCWQSHGLFPSDVCDNEHWHRRQTETWAWTMATSYWGLSCLFLSLFIPCLNVAMNWPSCRCSARAPHASHVHFHVCFRLWKTISISLLTFSSFS